MIVIIYFDGSGMGKQISQTYPLAVRGWCCRLRDRNNRRSDPVLHDLFSIFHLFKFLPFQSLFLVSMADNVTIEFSWISIFLLLFSISLRRTRGQEWFIVIYSLGLWNFGRSYRCVSISSAIDKLRWNCNRTLIRVPKIKDDETKEMHRKNGIFSSFSISYVFRFHYINRNAVKGNHVTYRDRITVTPRPLQTAMNVYINSQHHKLYSIFDFVEWLWKRIDNLRHAYVLGAYEDRFRFHFFRLLLDW